MDLHLRGKSVLVSGSSRGIGRAIAAAFLEEGANVTLTGRTSSDLADVAKKLEARYSGSVGSFCGDLSRVEGIQGALEVAASRWGRVDILVANLGAGHGAAGWMVDDDEWQRLLEANFLAAMRLARAVLPSMIAERSGSIVFISSIAGRESLPAPFAYSAAKMALLSLTKNLARDVAPHGVRVNAVAPGNIVFEGGRWEERASRDPAGTHKYIEEAVPLRRFGTPEEIASAVVFLSSARATFITGTCLTVDGGQTHTL
jgi:3-oxoacyl-[acyl-carrier protein] reductase